MLEPNLIKQLGEFWEVARAYLEGKQEPLDTFLKQKWSILKVGDTITVEGDGDYLEFIIHAAGKKAELEGPDQAKYVQIKARLVDFQKEWRQAKEV